MEYYNQDEQQPTPDKTLKGYKIIIIVLACVLAALSFQYFRQVNVMKEEFAIERDTLSNRIATLVTDYDNMTIANDTITANLNIEKLKADSLLQQLNQERNLSRRKIREYEKKFTLLRGVMKGYVQQIDSLNKVNHKLVTENITYRKEVSSQRLRADKAEEMSGELSTKIKKGAVIRARDLRLTPVNNNDREVTRAARAARLKVDFVLSSNDLAHPGPRSIYVRITGPDGYVLANSSNAVFDYEGDMITYSATRDIDYQNGDLGIGLYYNSQGIVSGKYKVTVYMDGHLIGAIDAILR